MIKVLISSFVITVFLTGCLTKELPSYTTYTLNLHDKTSENSENSENSVTINKSLLINQPKSLSSLKTKNILYSNQLEQNYYALSIWSDEPSKMIQYLLVNKIASTHSYNYVTSSKMKQQPDYSLYSELISFKHQIEDKNSYAVLKIRVYLKNNATSKIDTQEFYYKNEVEKNDAQSAVNVLNTITNTFLEDVSLFINKSIKTQGI